ncbi:AMP-dependent synthetase/ligase [Candidatus Poribacteria bacterium]
MPRERVTGSRSDGDEKEISGIESVVPVLFIERVQKSGPRPGLRKKEYGIWREISWDEYFQNVKTLALGLIDLGLKPGERVALISDNRPEWLYSDLGTMCAGGITVPVYVTGTQEQARYILEHSGSRFYIVENEEQLDRALEIRSDLPDLEKIIVVDREGLTGFSDPMVLFLDQIQERGRKLERESPSLFMERVNQLEVEEIATIVYTSGTTGPPKGVMLSHRNILAQCSAVVKGLELTGKDELLSYLPLAHIAERVLSVFLPLRSGYTVNFAESVTTVPQDLRAIEPTVFAAVPRIWEMFHSTIALRMKDPTWFKKQTYRLSLKIGRSVSQKWLERCSCPPHLWPFHLFAYLLTFRKLKKQLGLRRVRVALSTAAPISPEILAYFHAIGVRVKECYGQTEACGAITLHLGDDIKLGTVGEPLPSIEIEISEFGEILIRADNIFQGYYRDELTTKNTLKGGWHHSGDVGFFNEEGHLVITDRMKNLIITSSGENITPQKIENLLKESPYIMDAVVIGDKRKFLTALIALDEDNVSDYALENQITFTTYADMVKNRSIFNLINKEVASVNIHLAPHEKVKRFSILTSELSKDDEELTPTLKVRRELVEKRYREVIDSMYG